MARKRNRTPPPSWTPLEIAGRELLLAIKSFYTFTFPKLASQIKIDLGSLSDISVFRERPTPNIIKKLLIFREEQPIKCPLTEQCFETINSAIVDDRAAQSKRTIYAPYSFIAALGIDITAGEKSVEKYRGYYLHFNVNDAKELVTASCVLSERLGSDHAPIYRAWRVVKNDGYRQLWKFEGAYFTNEHHLFIIGSRKKKVDVRLSIIHVDFDDEQSVIRGMHLAVSSFGTVLASRCVLVKYDAIDRNIRKQLLSEPRSVEALGQHGCQVVNEIVQYLCGKEEPSYIKMAFGS